MKLFSRRSKRKQRNLKRPTGCFLGITIVLMMGLVAAPAWAASPGQSPNLVNQEEGQLQPPLSTAKITIEKKSLQHIFTLGQSFAINKETLIVGTDGKEVAIKKMLVPCDAVVSYLIQNGAPTAKRIDIKRVAANASWQWISEHPE